MSSCLNATKDLISHSSINRFGLERTRPLRHKGAGVDGGGVDEGGVDEGT